MSSAAEQYFPINALIHVHQAGVVPDIASSKKNDSRVAVPPMGSELSIVHRRLMIKRTRSPSIAAQINLE